MAGPTIAAILGLLATAAIDVQATAQLASPQTPSVTVVDRLDTFLASKDYVGLTRTITHPADATILQANLDWLRDRMRGGSTALVAVLYARML